MNERRPADFVRRVPGIAIPAHAFGSGWLDQIGGVGPRVIPLNIALPIKDAIAAGEIVICWISGEPILLERLHFDHIIRGRTVGRPTSPTSCPPTPSPT